MNKNIGKYKTKLPKVHIHLILLRDQNFKNVAIVAVAT